MMGRSQPLLKGTNALSRNTPKTNGERRKGRGSEEVSHQFEDRKMCQFFNHRVCLGEQWRGNLRKRKTEMPD